MSNNFQSDMSLVDTVFDIKALPRLLGDAARRVLDVVMPPRCGTCRAELMSRSGASFADDQALCPQCWSQLEFIRAPLCRSCGLPFEDRMPAEPNLTCAACLKDPPAFDWCRTAMRYDDRSKRLILALKHGDRLEKASVLARLMSASLPTERFDQCPILVPIPLHPERLRQRGFNQAQVMARSLARLTGYDLEENALIRVKATKSQGGLGRKGRARNVAHAFALGAGASGCAGRDVVLIDDVFTTGATVSAAARTMRRAKICSVGALCATRAPGVRA